jgi:predicted nucleic acid-binding protein
MVFIDTNVWVYALSGQDHAKREIAIELIARTYRDDMICVSSQVLKEFANFAFKKTKKSAAQINAMLTKIGSYSFVADTRGLIREATIGKEKWQVGFYDALMLAAANKAECAAIYTEDLNDGQIYGTVKTVNPFKSAASCGKSAAHGGASSRCAKQ